MKKNLSVSTYRNGDPIPQVTNPDTWATLTTGAWCWYNNDSANYAVYGKLYNWYAVTDPRGLAPQGWHIPTDAEWTSIVDFCYWNSTNAGGPLKDTGTIYWLPPNTGATNASKFTALPAGQRDVNGTFQWVKYYGMFWSATLLNSGYAWGRELFFSTNYVSRLAFEYKAGLSVRCVKD
jgi:uncharacterized protein (TIGR02145 family)